MTDEARQICPPNADTSIWNVIEKAALSADEEFELKIIPSLGLIYLSTPFSRSAANFLNEIGVEAFKIGSGEADNLPLIEHIANFGKPILMSTGMHSCSSLKSSVDIIESYGLDYALLECTSAYPTPPETVRLSAITEITTLPKCDCWFFRPLNWHDNVNCSVRTWRKNHRKALYRHPI